MHCLFLAFIPTCIVLINFMKFQVIAVSLGEFSHVLGIPATVMYVLIIG